jgi:STE24 endopeptidase
MNTAKDYERKKIYIFIIDLLIAVVFLLIVLLTGVSLYLRDAVFNLTTNFYLALLYYLLFLGFMYLIVDFPIVFYDGFVLEHKYNLSNETFTGWCKRQLKGILLNIILVIPLIEVLYLLMRHFPDMWWAISAAVWIILTIVLTNLAPIVILPFFYKSVPLDNTELNCRIEECARISGIKVKGIFRIDLSKETKKANAALAGIGNTKRILLSDTLLSGYAPGEIVTIFAHEAGHDRYGHMYKLFAFGSLVSFAGFYTVYHMVGLIVLLLGFKNVWDIAALPGLILAMAIFSLAVAPLQNVMSRYFERQADIFSLEVTRDSTSFISAMNKLSIQNLSDTHPNPLVEFLFYSHPPIGKRIKLAQIWESQRTGGNSTMHSLE